MCLKPETMLKVLHKHPEILKTCTNLNSDFVSHPSSFWKPNKASSRNKPPPWQTQVSSDELHHQPGAQVTSRTQRSPLIPGPSAGPTVNVLPVSPWPTAASKVDCVHLSKQAAEMAAARHQLHNIWHLLLTLHSQRCSGQNCTQWSSPGTTDLQPVRNLHPLSPRYTGSWPSSLLVGGHRSQPSLWADLIDKGKPIYWWTCWRRS